MSVITLQTGDSNQVPSASSFEALLGDPTLTLVIFSGIAAPAISIDDDSTIYRDDVVLKLGINVNVIHNAVTQVGLASISNGETQFVFATDTGRLEVDPVTGELQLLVQTAVLGGDTSLNRFSYQVVAHVTKVATRISGTIKVPRDVSDLSSFVDIKSLPNLAPLHALFRVTANRIEALPPDPNGFSGERLIPVATGKIVDVICSPEDCFVSYVIDGCPFNIPLKVAVDLTSKLQGFSAVQVAGPRVVVLTKLVPAVSGVDFEVIVTKVP